MRKYRNQIFIGLFIALAIYIGLLLLADSQGRLQTEGIVEQLRAFPIILILPLIFFQTLVIFFRFLEWHYYLGVIEARDKISLLDSFVIFVSTFTMVVSPGKAAELLKSVFLRAKSGVPIARSAPIVLAERIVDGLAVIVIMAITLYAAGDKLNLGTYNGINYQILSEGIIYSSLAIIVTGLIVVQIQPLAYFCLNIVRRIPLVNRLHQPLVEFYESSREIFKLQHVIPMTIIGVGVYISSAAGFVVVLYGFGLDITWQVIMQSAFIVGVASAIGALSFVPNGAGVTEISNTGMLLALVAPINPIVTGAVAAAAALIQGFFHKWFRVLVGLMVGLLFRKRLFSDDLENALEEAKSEHDAKKQAQSTIKHHPAI
ncbi:MAG: lysylphosphatidylglycerol synthase transmembrane domain-containing protein [Anaerolineae bacterium]|nr:lysylphosphatidylglycerol synthase transmembrane domain-containing protein [Anaerolineae bacterium]